MNRRGFTLVELLVVIAIIGMLVGLLLPAVNSAREQGRLASCKNNLHQLALACQGHETKLGFLPSGGWGSNWVGLAAQGYGQNQPGGWIYQILPYMEQTPLHDLDMTVTSGTIAKLVSTPITVLNCPTRRVPKAYPLTTTSSVFTNIGSTAARTDYAANGGSVVIVYGAGPTALPPPGYSQWPDLTTFNGIVSVHSQITMANITDEKATTYLIGEKYMSPEHYIDGQDAGDGYSAVSGDGPSLVRSACANCLMGATTGNVDILLPSQDRLAASNPPQEGYHCFGSAHSAGWNAAFLDGHAQLVGWGIDPQTHVWMSTRNGHEVIDPSKIPH